MTAPGDHTEAMVPCSSCGRRVVLLVPLDGTCASCWGQGVNAENAAVETKTKKGKR